MMDYSDRENNMTETGTVKAESTGGCLCSAVKFEIRGPMGGVLNCHCSKCRRFHGNVAAYTEVKRSDLLFINQEGLKWYRSVTDETPNVHRGFCKECGCSLFWDVRGAGETIWVAAGTLDLPTNIKTLGHVWLSQAGDYYEITDGLPRYPESHLGRLTGEKPGG
jgi:hypothetical protein